ncbi:hypothetical protein HYV22_04230 [Candidatus Gottesmanbacteria bacterium]|nr:hypothetical protein [Candidatus Gottesmanbacteria bacterium]
MDTVQIVIVTISIVLTTLIVLLGIQVWFIFKEVRRSIQKMNKMLDDFGKVTGTVGEGAQHLSGIASGIKAGMAVFSSFRKKGERNE